MTLAMTLFYNQGFGQYRSQSSRVPYELEQTLQPGEHMWVNIGDLIRRQITDVHGKVLPAALTSGTYEFKDMTDRAHGSLFEGKVIVDKTDGHATYGCAECCGHNGGTMQPMNMLVGTSGNGSILDQNSCETFAEDITGLFSSWSSANTAIATVNNTGLVNGMGVGSASMRAVALGVEEDSNGADFLHCPNRDLQSNRPANVYSVTINSANISTDSISVTLQSPTATTGQLTIALSGSAGSTTVYNGSAATGSGNYSFNLASLPIQEFTQITAQWVVSSFTAAAPSYSYHIKNLGSFRQTQYNTPAESSCTGGPQPVTVWSPSCVGKSTTVISGFDFRVTSSLTGTGSGHSIAYGDVSEEFTCSVGSGDLRSPFTIKGSLGPVNNATVAAASNNTDLYVAGRQLYIQGEGVKTVTDACSACSKDVTHLDNYTTNTACSGVPSLPNAITVILY